MARIQISCKDERLAHLLYLLLKEEHTVTADAPALLVTDEASIPLSLAHLPVLIIGDGGLARPFSHSALRHAVNASLKGEASSVLTATEARLFRTLREASPHPVSREVLIRSAFGEDGNDRLLNLYIHYLRKKLEADGKKRIFACRGKGYYYDAHDPCR